jgi:hypothetical protein
MYRRLIAHTLHVTCVFIILLAIFLLSPNRQLADSNYAMLLSEEIYRHGDFYLDRYMKPPLDPAKYPGMAGGDYPYMIEPIKGHLYYFYPPGSSILSVPYVAVANRFGVSAVGPGEQYDVGGEMAIQSGLAALLMAAFGACVFITAHLVTGSFAWSYVVAGGTALGTQVWSTASRVVWSHTWGILLLSLAILYLVGQQRQRWRINPIVLASLLIWTYFVRPTDAISYALVSVYVAVKLRSLLLPYVVTSLVWVGLFVLYSEYYFGRLLPTQYVLSSGFELNPPLMLQTLAGLLLSPSRGVLVFSPVLLVVAFWAARYRRFLPFPGLFVLGAAACVLQLVLVSSWKIWWGGHSFGPRLLADVVPWLALLAIAAVSAWRCASARDAAAPGQVLVARYAELAVAGALLALSVWINGRGAISIDTAWWNDRPVPVDVQPDRVWDWRQPQFLAGPPPASGAP